MQTNNEKMIPVKLDVSAIVHKFGGRQKLYQLLNVRTIEPISRSGVDKWLDRNQIPSPRILDLLMLSVQEHGEPLDLYQFITT